LLADHGFVNGRLTRFRAVQAAAALLGVLALGGCNLQVELDAPTATPTPVGSLGALKVAAESHQTGYRRTAFGQRWKDVDRNGCGQRDDVLARDLKSVQKRGRCVVVAGVLVDPYTGEQVRFTKADANAVQIDHRVALAEAWRSGAWTWTPARREAFANDEVNLVASKGSVNQGKGDDDAAHWLPVGPSRQCLFARQVVAVKAKYALTVDPDEATALRRALALCPKQ
jgi:hypothetical protein